MITNDNIFGIYCHMVIGIGALFAAFYFQIVFVKFAVSNRL
jgi:hypothetical protein